MAGRLHMMINPINVCCGQSARKVYMMSSWPFCICCNMPLLLRTIPSFLVEWPPYKVVIQDRQRRNVTRKFTGAGDGMVLHVVYWAPASLLVASDAVVVKRR